MVRRPKLINIEEGATACWPQAVRPLVEAAYRCYTTGSVRACTVLIWTAVCADVTRRYRRLLKNGKAMRHASSRGSKWSRAGTTLAPFGQCKRSKEVCCRLRRASNSSIRCSRGNSISFA